MTRLEVRTTVTLPDFDGDGLKQGEAVYIDQKDVVEWLDSAAYACDEASAHSDVGKVLRACATVFSEVEAK